MGRSTDPSPERGGGAAGAAGAAAAAESGAASGNGRAAGVGGKPSTGDLHSKAGAALELSSSGAGGKGRQSMAVDFVPITLVCRNLRWAGGGSALHVWGTGADALSALR